MAQTLFLLRRSSLPSLSISIYLRSASLCSTAAAASGLQTQSGVEKGRWFTLPPFTSSSLDPSALGKRIASPSSIQNPEPTNALKWVLRCCPRLPRALVQKLFRLRQVRKESVIPTSGSLQEFQVQERRPRRVSAKDAMNEGDKILLPMTVQEFPSEKKDYCCTEDEIKYIQSLELHKDPAIIVVNKPAGMPVQGGIGITKSLDMLAATALRYDYSEPPRLVHRLDRDSSGILVMGRTQTSATILHSIFREKTSEASVKDKDETERILQRRYWALVIGIPKRAKGLICAPLAKVVLDNGKSERITIADDWKSPLAQHAVTEYRLIKSSEHGYSWLELSPLTGRKHQLRVHCAEALRTPIVGDSKYGWQAHRKWRSITLSKKPESDNEKLREQKLPFGLDLGVGSVAEKEPRLHLYCRQMVLPDVAEALEQLQSSLDGDLSKVGKLKFVAPLPVHMQRSWDILSGEIEKMEVEISTA